MAEPRNAMTRALSRLRAFQQIFADAHPHRLEGRVLEAWDPDAFDWTEGQYICGLADASGHELGLGILNEVGANGVVEITTAAAPNRVHRIRVGMVLPDELKTQ
jgi:hypothetical protein